jgi:Secretory lipase
VWGHSQGLQASLYTGLIAASYAPELKLVGVAAAAPATPLVTLMSDDFRTSGGKNLTAMTLWSTRPCWRILLRTVCTKAVVWPWQAPTHDASWCAGRAGGSARSRSASAANPCGAWQVADANTVLDIIVDKIAHPRTGVGQRKVA